MSPAGTSKLGPIWRCNSVIKLWQKRMISASDLPLGSKSDPPLPPPIGRPVRAFLKICSKPKNFRMDKLTDGWNLKPPLYGPIAELNCTRKPRLTCHFPASSCQGTRNWMARSGSVIISTKLCSKISGCSSKNGVRLAKNSSMACKNSGWFGSLAWILACNAASVVVVCDIRPPSICKTWLTILL